ncbi:putative late blight resistance protein homolog R1A-4 [Salvia hispanica]|uniref:putative late blight resistance protein homolog R1A-4 n=1 Tax=Salvia hispanica TaxID=49212 RepID=UPI002009D0B6|nr:putative late blight resistance protein homolog R1A-4 [Salvia hispanica]
MAAYGAAISLKNTIQRILQSSRISLVSPSPQISYSSYSDVFDNSYFKAMMAAYGKAKSLKNKIRHRRPSPHLLQQAYDAMCRLQKVLLKLEETSCSKIRTKVNALDERIKEVVWEFEDLLESLLADQLLAQLESSQRGEGDQLSFSVDLLNLQRCVDYLLERVRAMEAEYDIELANMPEEEGEPVSSRIDFGGISTEMVGLSDEFERVRDYLLAEEDEWRWVAVINWMFVIGMAGAGKTTLAKKVFDDPSIQRHFELRAWVRVGRKCESNETLRCILAQVDPSTRDQMLTHGEDGDDDFEKLVGILEERLKDKKCLIVMDDVWEWDRRLMDRFPKENVRILLTSRLRFNEEPPSFIRENNSILLRSLLGDKGSPFQVVRLLSDEESKKLLGEKVFGGEGFPPHLEKLGEKIAKKCEGLPLMIVKVSELLSEEDKTPEFWTEVAEKQHNFVFDDAYEQISEVLFPSYDYLPQYLKMLFLYLGAFPPYSDIEIQKIFNLMSAEGFFEPIGEKNLENFIKECLEKLAIRYHLILFEASLGSLLSKSAFRAHSCWQYLCRKEASKIKFLHVLQSCDDVMKDQRRLGAHYNTLFAFKQVSDSIKSDCASTIRSLLCLGPYHQYPVSIHAMDYKLLWVLDALRVRFYHVPLEILKLVSLKYLSLTCNNEIPESISNLFQLETLNVGQHMNIKKRGGQSYVPVEIWNMQELQHIEILGRDLPTPNFDSTLDKLTGLRGVSPKSCTREVLQRIPNLKEMIICMELKPYDNDDWFNALNGLGYISEELQNLVRLSYIVRNPEIKYEFMVPLRMFPSSLTYLQLSGLGCPWEYMNDIGSLLPNLTDLMIEEYAFRGPEWDIKSECFLKLETLVIEDTDLERWRAQHGSLPKLEMLSIRHCYKFKQLDWTRDPSTDTTPTIELLNCSLGVIPSAMLLHHDGFKVDLGTSYL